MCKKKPLVKRLRFRLNNFLRNLKHFTAPQKLTGILQIKSVYTAIRYPQVVSQPSEIFRFKVNPILFIV